MINRQLFFLFAVLGMALGFSSAARAQGMYEPYGGFNYYTQGSGRVLAMGGAYAALSEGAAGINENPAAPAIGNYKFDFSAANTRVANQIMPDPGVSPGLNFVTNSNGVQTTIYNYDAANQQPSSFVSYSSALQIGRLAIGIGYSTPYDYEYKNDFQGNGQNISSFIRVTSLDAFAALRITDESAIGVSWHNQTLDESFVFSGNFPTYNGKAEQEAVANSLTYGAIYKGKVYGVGVTFTPSYQFTINETLYNDQAIGEYHAWFRDFSVPSLIVVGGYYRLSDHFLLALDIDQYAVPLGLVAVSSGFCASSCDSVLTSGTINVYHAGAEWTVRHDQKVDLILRGGAYNEPAPYSGGESRLHKTFGVRVRFGPAVLEVSFDIADKFTNTSQGFSIAVGSI